MKYFRIQLLSRSLLALCFCFLTFQASAQRVIDPSRFEDAIQAFEKMDQIDMPPQGSIVLTGSSSIARWNNQAAAALSPLTVIPRGFGGSVMEDLLYYLDRVALIYKPRAILIYEGDNDTSYGISENKIVTQFEQIVAKVYATMPETRIYVLSVKPSVARLNVWSEAQQVSERLEAISKSDPQIHYVDVASPFLKVDGSVMTDIFVEDNLHLNDKGNEIWGATIKAALMTIESQYE